MAKAGRAARARRPRRPEPVTYVVAVRDWSIRYRHGLGLGDARFDEGPCSEVAEVTFRGEVTGPPDLKHPRAELVLRARKAIPSPAGTHPCAASAGPEARGDVLFAYAFLPAGNLTAVLAAAVAGQVRSAAREGWVPRYRRSESSGITLATGLDEDDLLGGPPAGSTAVVGEARAPRPARPA